ncbi:hypothetical protein DOT37_21070 [Pantoea agglomerans]|nr:hypothetical protein DOT37_21070 [Pantoea agglomerans]
MQPSGTHNIVFPLMKTARVSHREKEISEAALGDPPYSGRAEEHIGADLTPLKNTGTGIIA